MSEQDVRQYAVQARSTDTFGRVICSARDHHFVVDGPVQNGCPGEAITPAEVFLSGVAACGVELIHVIAAQQQTGLESVHAEITGTMDGSKKLHPHFTLFESVRVEFDFLGITAEQGAALVEAFKGR